MRKWKEQKNRLENQEESIYVQSDRSSKPERRSRQDYNVCEFRDWACQGRQKVLLVEADAQGSMAVSLGVAEPDELDVTLVNIMEKVINDEDAELGEGIIHHEEGIDFIPANIELAGLETALVNVMSRETILRQYLNSVKGSMTLRLLIVCPRLA